MSIGMALAGLATIVAAAHPRGVRGLMGTPEEHLAKFREYLAIAQNVSMPDQIRRSSIERAWAESEWTRVPADDVAALRNAEAVLSIPDTSSAPARSNLVMSRPREKRPTDTRHPPAGWKTAHSYKGTTWLLVSLGDGRYEAKRGGQVIYSDTGNTVLFKIHGYAMDFYGTTGLGKPKAVFDPLNPPSGWYR